MVEIKQDHLLVEDKILMIIQMVLTLVTMVIFQKKLVNILE